jgi:transcriptional regulator with XRE-family HTH domain
MRSFRKELRRQRLKRNLPLVQLARQLDVSVCSIVAWEDGRCFPSHSSMSRLCAWAPKLRRYDPAVTGEPRPIGTRGLDNKPRVIREQPQEAKWAARRPAKWAANEKNLNVIDDVWRELACAVRIGVPREKRRIVEEAIDKMFKVEGITKEQLHAALVLAMRAR